MHKILLIEDDSVIILGLTQTLKEEGYQVVSAQDGEQGLYAIKTESPDLVICDIMMPNMNGFEVISETRRLGENVPFIVLSARTGSPDKIKGLDLGADDYVSKPFDLEELLARIRRLLSKRSGQAFIFGNYEYNWKSRSLLLNTEKTSVTAGRPITLQTKERLLLEFLIKRANQLVSREQILDGVWGSDYDGTDRTVDNVIVSLRKKLGSKHLITERGIGYRFVTKL